MGAVRCGDGLLACLLCCCWGLLFRLLLPYGGFDCLTEVCVVYCLIVLLVVWCSLLGLLSLMVLF